MHQHPVSQASSTYPGPPPPPPPSLHLRKGKPAEVAQCRGSFFPGVERGLRRSSLGKCSTPGTQMLLHSLATPVTIAEGPALHVDTAGLHEIELVHPIHQMQALHPALRTAC